MNFGRVLIWILVLAPYLVAGNKEQRAAQIIGRAQRVNATYGDQLPAYRQTADFVIKAPGLPDVSGKFMCDFLDSTHRRRRIISGAYDGSYVRSGDKAYRKSSAEFTPTILSTVEQVVPPLFIPHNEKVLESFRFSRQT